MTSAGILLYRRKETVLQFFLIHPGGPYFAGKDASYWSIPKGLIEEGEDPLAAARREFEEETGCACPGGPFIPLAPVQQKGGKTVLAWAVEGDCDPTSVTSNSFSLEWPPRSGRMQTFPEVDRAGWFSLDEGKRKINPAQATLLTELTETLI
jgi:predicted NUDIX family NTP pyrophosphohydrolase